MSQNNETAAVVVYQTNPVGVEPLSYEKTFFCSNKLCEKKVYHLGIKMKTSMTIVFILLIIPNSKLPVQM